MTKTSHIVFLLLIALLGTSLMQAQNADPIKRELRSVWLTTVWGLDWPQTTGTSPLIIDQQKHDLTGMLDKLQQQNFNAVFFQVRSMCDAMYRSSYEPWSSYLTGRRGTDPGWDPLAFTVEECHKRGLQCYAWVNPYRWSTGNTWHAQEDTQFQNEKMLLRHGKITILNPGLTSVRKHIVKVCREIVKNYDIDGLVFDDYFYPEGTPNSGDAPDYKLWKESGTDMNIADWRRDNVNQMVADVYEMIQLTKPECAFGISPAGVAGASASQFSVEKCPKGVDWQYRGIFSDPLAWLNAGNIDFISPQIYWKTSSSSNPFGPITEWWSNIAPHFGRHHYASHSLEFLNKSNSTNDWLEIANQIEYSRRYARNNASGVVFYSAKFINGPARRGLGEFLHEHVFNYKALPPAFTWKKAKPVGKPAGLRAGDGGTLSWRPVQGRLIKYAVYAVPVDVPMREAKSSKYGGISSEYLIELTYQPSCTLLQSYQRGHQLLVTAIDAYGNESEPAALQ